MIVEDVLLECELMLMDIGHQLSHWAEILEQGRFAARLDGAIDVQFNCFPKSMFGHTWVPAFIDAYQKEIQRADEIDNSPPLIEEKVYPLAWYEDGTRFEVGTAVWDPVHGMMTARVEESLTRGLGVERLIWDRQTRYSIAPETFDPKDENYGGYKIRLLPFPDLRKATGDTFPRFSKEQE